MDDLGMTGRQCHLEVGWFGGWGMRVSRVAECVVVEDGVVWWS